MNNEAITLKGIKDGIMVILAADVSIDKEIELIGAKLSEVLDFLMDAGNKIVISGRQIDGIDRIKLEHAIMQVVPGHVSIEYEGNELFRTSRNKKNEKSQFYHGTLRSGQSIRSMSNLVVVGDVNPGAELIAVGNIVVVGSLRGIVHAGCNGDKDAIVAAVKMSPVQIRIADIITRPPDGDVSDEWVPEIAYIKDGNIYIDDYLSKK